MNHLVHKYTRVKLGTKGYIVYKCTLPGCPHYLRQELVTGRLCECWRCGKPFTMTVKTLLKKPHCSDCTKIREIAEKTQC